MQKKVSTSIHLMPVSVGLFHSSNILKSEMPCFRWPDHSHNVTFLTEMALARREKPADWDLIAITPTVLHIKVVMS